MTIKKIATLTLLLLLLIPLTACSSDKEEQNNILNEFEVLVLEKDIQEKIAGAEVIFAGKHKKTNQNGVASFKDIKEGYYKLVIKAANYQEYSKEKIEVSTELQRYKAKIERINDESSKFNPELIVVPSGTTSEANANLNLAYDIYLSKYPTTFAEYKEYVRETGAELPADEGWGYGNRPLINVSYYDAIEYANWLSKQEDLEVAYDLNTGLLKDQPEYLVGYRLATENEWEYAARGGEDGEATIYAGSDNIDQVAWYLNNSDQQSHPVGEKEANELGLYDLSGNVEEWTTTKSASKYIVRGGAWRFISAACEVDAKESFVANTSNSMLGFRIARTKPFLSYPLNINQNGEGEINIEPDRNKYRADSTVLLEATPKENWEFKEWSGDLSGTKSTKEVTITEELNITANFTKKEGALNLNVQGNGSIDITPQQTEYKLGDIIEVAAIADPGWEFKAWSGDLSGADNTKEITIIEELNITALFEKKTYSLNIIAENGRVLVEPEKEKYEYDESVELSAKADRAWEFVAWGGDLSGTNATRTIVIDSDLEIKAKFQEKDVKTVRFEIKDENGLAIKGLKVQLGDYQLFTDEEGIAAFNYLDKGWYNYSIEEPDYEVYSASIYVEEDITKQIKLDVKKGEIEIEVTLPSSLDKPRNLAIDKNNNLTWEYSEDADIYSVYRSKSSDPEDLVFPIANVETEIFSGIEKGYYYWLRAYVDGRSSALSEALFIE